MGTINKLGFLTLEHPPKSLDPTPSEFHLFGPLKETFRDRRFVSNTDVRDAVQKWFQDRQEALFLEGILKLVARWTKCNAKGETGEK